MASIWCLDTNILISGLVFRGAEHTLLEWLRDHRESILWFPTLENEVTDVLARKFNVFDVDWTDVFSDGIRIKVPEPPPEYIGQAIEELRDPKDGPILATARYYKADYLVTGDKDLLVLASSEKLLRIVTTKEVFSIIG